MTKKKARSAKKLKGKAKANAATAATAGNSNNNNDDEDDDIDIDKVPSPENGWVVEKQEARDAIKSERNEMNILRLARAYRKLRQWEKLGKFLSPEALSSIELEQNISSGSMKTLVNWSKDATNHLAIRTRWNEAGSELSTKNIRSKDMNCDRFSMENLTYNNLMVLHYAAHFGDVRLLENAIAMGSAIDIPVGEPQQHFRGVPAPKGTTPLLLACYALALYGYMTPKQKVRVFRQEPQIRRVLEGNLECAIQLVKLGADCKIVYKLNGNYIPMIPMEMHKQCDNKNAFQLAILAKEPTLIQAMEKFNKSDEDRIRLVHCRCGSRLPWIECHGGKVNSGAGPHYREEDGKIIFRYSPVARCWCTYHNKEHYKCCWEDDLRYQNDSTGELFAVDEIRRHEGNNDFFNSLIGKKMGHTAVHSNIHDECFELVQNFVVTSRMIKAGDTNNEIMFSGMNRGEYFNKIKCQIIPNKDQMLVRMLNHIDSDGFKSIMTNWDLEVYFGIVEKGGLNFGWIDLHWEIPKAELMIRTKNWNTALTKYCDDENLTGSERDKTITMYTANEFAPCGNPGCNEYEINVKSFSKCTGCRKIAYCGRRCQARHWRSHHKGKCLAGE